MTDPANPPSVVFMGTPRFAVPSLEALHNAGYRLTVVTQPDRPSGRGGKLTPPPVKTAAERLGYSVIQPSSLRDPDFRAQMAALAPDVTVLVAYGEYVAPALLDLPRNGSVNLHPSLLPRWRGSTPIQAAILAGDAVTGVSIIRMDRGLDTGPILAQTAVPVLPDETHPELSERLAGLGAILLVETLPLWLQGEITPAAQDDSQATLTRTLQKSDGLIDWTRPAEEIARQVRAMQPWPGTHTHWNGRMLKILRARPAEASAEMGELYTPGRVSLTVTAGGTTALTVAAGEGALQVLELQLEGRPPTAARDFLSGYGGLVGSVLESPGLTARGESGTLEGSSAP